MRLTWRRRRGTSNAGGRRVARATPGDLSCEIGTGAIRDMFILVTALRTYHMAREAELSPELAEAMLASV